MRPTLYVVEAPGPGRLATMARPRGGDWLDDEMSGLAALAVDVLVSLLTDAEMAEFDLGDEERAARSAGMEFARLPISDLGVPDRVQLNAVVAGLMARRAEGMSVVVHCRQGIGRSSLVAATVLAAEGLDPDDAWARIEHARGRPVPDTAEQRAFVASR